MINNKKYIHSDTLFEPLSLGYTGLKGKEYMMTHPFYCQADYQSLPFTLPLPQEIKDEMISCFCASSMMVEGMLDLCFPPEECFRFASQCGLENCTGDLFSVFCGALAGRFCLRLTRETVLSDALERLRSRNAPWLLLPVRREAVLTDTQYERLRHIVLVNGAQEDKYLMMDPMFRPGRSNRHIRRNRLHQEGDRTVVSREVLMREYTGAPFFAFSRG